MIYHKKKLIRYVFTRRFRIRHEDRLKRLNCLKLFRLRKVRWHFRRKSFTKYLQIRSRPKFRDKIYAEDVRMDLTEQSYFYNLYRFYAYLRFGKEKEFAEDLNIYTKPTALYPANNYSSEKTFGKLTKFKNKLLQLTNNLSKQQKNALLVEEVRNGEFKFKIVKNKRFSIKRKEKQSKTILQEKIVQNKSQNKNAKKGNKQTGKKPLVQNSKHLKNVQKVTPKKLKAKTVAVSEKVESPKLTWKEKRDLNFYETIHISLSDSKTNSIPKIEEKNVNPKATKPKKGC